MINKILNFLFIYRFSYKGFSKFLFLISTLFFEFLHLKIFFSLKNEDLDLLNIIQNYIFKNTIMNKCIV